MTTDERRALDAALAALPDRLRLVLELRFLTEPGWTLKQLGERLGLSYQRVAQLQGRALWLVGWWLRMSGRLVSEALDRIVTARPKSITVDHRTEFSSRALEDWPYQRRVRLGLISRWGTSRKRVHRSPTAACATSV